MTENFSHSKAGLSIVELIVATSILGVVAVAGTRFMTSQQAAVNAEANRMKAKLVGNDAKEVLRERFLAGGSVMDISSTGGNILLNFGTDPSSPTFTSVQNTCIAKPPGAVAVPPSSLPAECVWNCPAGKVPQIRVSYLLPSGASATRLFPTDFRGLYGAVLCAKEFAEVAIFPISDRAPDYSVLIYTGWATNKSGTQKETLWTVDGLFLPGGVDRSLLLLDQKTGP